MSDATQRFTEAAKALGLHPQPRHFPAGTKTADDAARAVGCDVGQIVKSLVFMADDRPVLAFKSGSNRVDESKLAAVAGADAVRRATPDEARAATGFAVGGTPPFGFPEPVRTFVDETPLAFEEVWAAAGAPDSVFPLRPDDLVRVTGATVADLAAG